MDASVLLVKALGVVAHGAAWRVDASAEAYASRKIDPAFT